MTPRFQEGLNDSPLDEQGWHGTSTAMATRCVNSALSLLSPLFGSFSIAFIPLPDTEPWMVRLRTSQTLVWREREHPNKQKWLKEE